MIALLLVLVSVALALYKLYEVLLSLRVDGEEAKTVVISGCDSGFGHLLALRLLDKRVPVLAGCLTENGREGLVAAAGRNAKHLHVLLLNVADDASVAEFRQAVTGGSENGVIVQERRVAGAGVWGVVCNAGILGATGPDEWLHVNDYINTMQVNTFGVMRMVHEFTELVKVQRGRIVIIASVSGRTPRPTVGPYCVSKHAVEAYADVIRHELLDFGVSVHVLEPGFFTTNITQSATDDLEKIWERLSAAKQEAYGQRFFEQYRDGRKSRLSHCAADLTPVVDAYEHALLARFPKRRYWVGWDTVAFYIPLATLPTLLQDIVMRVQRRARPLPATAKPATFYGLF